MKKEKDVQKIIDLAAEISKYCFEKIENKSNLINLENLVPGEDSYLPHGIIIFENDLDERFFVDPTEIFNQNGGVKEAISSILKKSKIKRFFSFGSYESLRISNPDKKFVQFTKKNPKEAIDLLIDDNKIIESFSPESSSYYVLSMIEMNEEDLSMIVMNIDGSKTDSVDPVFIKTYEQMQNSIADEIEEQQEDVSNT